MLIQDKQIAIIGAGPGGLSLARLLQLKGANIKVYERDVNAAARVQGSPLDMHEGSGWAVLHKAELTAEFKQYVRHGADKKVIVNKHVEVLFSDHESKPQNAPGNETDRPEIDRGALRELFLNALNPQTVIWDSQFISIEQQKEGWLLQFKNGTSAYADIVVATDGANSKLRPYVTNVKAFYTGITMIEINVDDAANVTPRIYELLNGGKVMAFGNGENILGGQKGDGGLGFYLSLKLDENWAVNSGLDLSDKTQLLAWFKQQYRGWSNTWYERIAKAKTPFIPRPIYCVPLDQSWKTLTNLTLLGDAAHVMPPFAGEGANTSMFDALELSECLTSDKYDTLTEAIADYEISMRYRAAKAAKQSLENGERLHSENSLQKQLAIIGVN